jgi:hypothetical protein
MYRVLFDAEPPSQSQARDLVEKVLAIKG